MVHSTLQEVKNSSTSNFCSSEKPKASYVLSGSPQSTLCAVGSWSGCSGGSSQGSPNRPSQVSSPPTTLMNEKDDACDLLYAAIGQVVRMKMNEEKAIYHHGRGLLGLPRKPTSVTVPLKNPNVESSYYSTAVENCSFSSLVETTTVLWLNKIKQD